MKHTKWIAFLFLLMFITGIPLSVAALDTGLTTEDLSDEEISQILEERSFVKITSCDPLMVKCFDIREDHMIVIGAGGAENTTIAVYDNCGNFQYGFKTEESGSFRVMWSGNEIAYYSIRGQLLYKINEDGEITDVRRVPSSKDNSVYDEEVLCANTRTVGTNTYTMTNGSKLANIFAGSFKNITKTDENGTTVIYDASAHQRTQIVTVLLIILVLIPILGFGAIEGINRTRDSIKKKMEEEKA